MTFSSGALPVAPRIRPAAHASSRHALGACAVRQHDRFFPPSRCPRHRERGDCLSSSRHSPPRPRCLPHRRHTNSLPDQRAPPAIASRIFTGIPPLRHFLRVPQTRRGEIPVNETMKQEEVPLCGPASPYGRAGLRGRNPSRRTRLTLSESESAEQGLTAAPGPAQARDLSDVPSHGPEHRQLPLGPL